MLKDFLWYFPAVLLPRFGAFILIIFGAKLLGAEQYGLLSLVTIIGEGADLVLTNWVRIGIARLGSSEHGLDRLFVYKTRALVFRTTLLSTIFAGAIGATLSPPHQRFAVCVACMAYITGIAILRFTLATGQTAGQRKICSLVESLRALASISIAILCMYFFRNYLVIIFVQAVIAALAGLIIWSNISKSSFLDLLGEVEVEELMCTLRNFGYPLIFLGLLLQGITALDKFVLSKNFPMEVLGKYYAAFAVARTPIDVLCSAMNTGAFIRISALYNDGKIEQVSEALGKQLTLIMGLTLPVLFVWWSCAADLGKLLIGPTYSIAFQDAGLAIAIGAIAMNLRGNIFDAILHMRMKNMLQIPALSCGLAVSIFIAISSHATNAFETASNMYMWSSVSAGVVAATVSSTLIKIRFNPKKLILLIAAFASTIPLWLLLISDIYDSITRVVIACLLCVMQISFNIWMLRR